MSAVAPASNPRNNTGKLAAVCINAISSGDVVSTVISQVPAVSCIHVPRLDTVDATHRSRNSGIFSGSNAFELPCSVSVVLAISVESTCPVSPTPLGCHAGTPYPQVSLSMGPRCFALLLCLASAAAQQPIPASPAPPSAQSALTDKPLPPIPQLVLDLEQNEKRSEAAARDYTYHVHFQQLELNNSGDLKKTTTIDSESLTIDGVRIDRVVARDGKPLTPAEAQKESDHIDKEVAKAKERRAKADTEGKDTDSDGRDVITASRILELGTFSNPRRILVAGRPTIEVDYNGDPKAKSHNPGEAAIKLLTGIVCTACSAAATRLAGPERHRACRGRRASPHPSRGPPPSSQR